MYDYHMHTRVSFDGHDTGLAMATAARERGLTEICFTDHIDYTPEMDMVFDTAVYNAEYDDLLYQILIQTILYPINIGGKHIIVIPVITVIHRLSHDLRDFLVGFLLLGLLLLGGLLFLRCPLLLRLLFLQEFGLLPSGTLVPGFDRGRCRLRFGRSLTSNRQLLSAFRAKRNGTAMYTGTAKWAIFHFGRTPP